MVVRGAETFILRDQRLHLRTGEALLMPPEIEYGSEISQFTESFSAFFPRRLYVELAGRVCNSSGDWLEGVQQQKNLLEPTVPIKADAALMTGLRTARELLELQAYERAEELLQDVALSLLFTTRELQNAEEQLTLARRSQRRELLRRLQRARAYLHDNIVQQVDLECLAEVSLVSRFHLLRSFRQAFGVTPAQYHAELRLQRAALMLQKNQLSVSDVALAVGFKNHSAFSRAWKRRYGYVPSKRNLDDQ